MKSKDELRAVLQTLLERSRKDEVNWRASENRYDSDVFSVELPQSMITIQRIQPTADPDYYRVAISNTQGREVFSMSASEDAQNPEEGESLVLLRDLYDDAMRCVTGWDKVLDDLRTAVESDRPVGLIKNDVLF